MEGVRIALLPRFQVLFESVTLRFLPSLFSAEERAPLRSPCARDQLLFTPCCKPTCSPFLPAAWPEHTRRG